MKTISFRFDIDTDYCLKVGVPELIRLADELDCKFTLFLNTGRAISYRYILESLLRTGEMRPSAAKLGSVRRMGLWQVCKILLTNPKLITCVRPLQQLLASGHEVGLHGGSNHAAWQYGALGWSQEKLERELAGGIRNFRRVAGRDPLAFSSPGWTSPVRLPVLLQRQGFAYMADRHGPLDHDLDKALPDLATQFTGEPGGVGYLEYLQARQLDFPDAIAEFRRDAERYFKESDHLVLYDHPGFAGAKGLPLMAGIIRAAQEAGYSILKLEEVCALINRKRPGYV